jgi:hypothetical protein
MGVVYEAEDLRLPSRRVALKFLSPDISRDRHTGEPIFEPTLTRAFALTLEQSPYLRTLSESRIRETLGRMGLPPDAAPSPSSWTEICLRAAASLLLRGSLSRLGTLYVLQVEALDCETGETVARDQTEADRREDVLDAIETVAARLRGRLGESRESVQRYDRPLPDVTTPSLEALRA